jgi:hypothetical protein
MQEECKNVTRLVSRITSISLDINVRHPVSGFVHAMLPEWKHTLRLDMTRDNALPIFAAVGIERLSQSLVSLSFTLLIPFEVFEVVCSVEWPHLQELSIQLDATCPSDSLQRLVRRMPKLTALRFSFSGLHVMPRTDEVCVTNLAAQLMSLTFFDFDERENSLLSLISLRSPSLQALEIRSYSFPPIDVDLLQQSIGRLHSLTSISMSTLSERTLQTVVQGLAALPPESIRNILSITFYQRLSHDTEGLLLALILKHRPVLQVLRLEQHVSRSFDCSIKAARKEQRGKGSGRLLLYQYLPG